LTLSEAGFETTAELLTGELGYRLAARRGTVSGTFLIDEPAGTPRTHLKLPPWPEPAREEIEEAPPKVRLPEYAR
jgi:hypothetical protein